MNNQAKQLSTRLGEALAARQLKVTTAESCTGGGIAQAITDIPGSSAWFEYGFVTYSNTAKRHLLGVEESVLAAYGAVSEPVVQQMAAGACRKSSADISVAVSGVAGPDGGSADKPVGTVWFAWRGVDGLIHSQRHQFSGDRTAVREQAVTVALEGCLKLV